MKDVVQIELGSSQFITDITKEQVEVLKQELTFDNPAYKNALKYSRYKYTSIPKTLTYYHESSYEQGGEIVPCIVVPIGVNVPEILGVDTRYSDERFEIPVQFPEFKLELRDTQKEAMKAYFNAHSTVKESSIVQLPTGKGKTVLALKIASVLNQKTLILVHKNDLVLGWQKDIEKAFDGKVKSGLIKAKSRKIGKEITIATVQTINRMSEQEKNSLYTSFGFVIVDECHHIGASTFNIIDEFDSRYKLGLSATPKRSDGLNQLFDLYLGGLCYKYDSASDDKDISSVKVIKRVSRANFLPFIYEGRIFNLSDFRKEELPSKLIMLEDIEYKKRPKIPHMLVDNFVVSNPKHLIMVCHDILENYKKGFSCVAFFTQKEHIVQYYNYLTNFIDKKNIVLYYGDSKESDEKLLEKAESKEALITLTTYSKATEGTNVKSWEVGFFVSPIKNDKNVEQAVGRIRRTKEGKLNPVLLYDYRFPSSYSLRNYGGERDKVYRNLHFIFDREESHSLFNRGY